MRDHAADVRALRRQSNAAIAALDADLVASYMHEDVEVTVAGGPVLRGRAANRDAFAAQMAERSFDGYVRTPKVVTIRGDSLIADERGHWVGRWRVQGRMREQRGEYTAEWHCTPLGWFIVREVYRGALD